MIGYICVWVTIISGVERVWSVCCYSCTGSADFTNLCVGASTAVYPGMTRRQSHVRRTEGWNSGYNFRITTSGSMMIGEWAILGRGREIGFCPRDYGIGQSTASFNNKYIIWKWFVRHTLSNISFMATLQVKPPALPQLCLISRYLVDVFCIFVLLLQNVNSHPYWCTKTKSIIDSWIALEHTIKTCADEKQVDLEVSILHDDLQVLINGRWRILLGSTTLDNSGADEHLVAS